MLAGRTRALLDRYALASKALSRVGGEGLALEAGHSVEFHDFRPYQSGDELRYVDWRLYARTGRLYTRLFLAERAVQLHLLLDTSRSMGEGGKLAYARTLVRLLSYVAHRDAPTQVHLLDGSATSRSRGVRGMLETWRFIEAAPLLDLHAPGPLTGIARFATHLPTIQGRALVIVVSDLLEDVPPEPSLAALRARGLDVGFLQVLSREELDPPPGPFELHDVETGERLPVGPEEARAYRGEVRSYLKRTRAAVLRAGYRHRLFTPPPGADAADETAAFRALVGLGLLVKR